MREELRVIYRHILISKSEVISAQQDDGLCKVLLIYTGKYQVPTRTIPLHPRDKE